MTHREPRWMSSWSPEPTTAAIFDGWPDPECCRSPETQRVELGEVRKEERLMQEDPIEGWGVGGK